MKNKLDTLIAVLAFLLLPLNAIAENSTRIGGGYIVHHSAFTTDTLAPQVARNYGIQRSKNRGMLTVNVVKEMPGSIALSTPAEVKVMASDPLTGQSFAIEMRLVKDGDAFYYLGDFPVSNQETLQFVIEVKPEGANEPSTAKLTQQFFTE